MCRSFINVFKKIADWRIIAGYLAIFLLILLFPYKIVPDFLNIRSLSAKKEIIFKLLTTVLGFSGIILTILLVVYNFYFKSIRRNTLEFIIDNNWLRLIFSLFFGNIFFLSIGFFLVETNPLFNDITVLYFSYFATILFIILLFPLSFLSLSDSVSLQRVQKIVSSITENDIAELYNPDLNNTQRHIEKNPLLILKDVAIGAIADKDWVLPQTILSALYQMLIVPLKVDSSQMDLQMNIKVWALICTHFKRAIIDKNDSTTAYVLLQYNLAAQRQFAENKIVSIRGNEIDEFLLDYFRQIIEKNIFFELQSNITTNAARIVSDHFKALHYSDEQIPVGDYYYERIRSVQNFSHPHDALTNHWYYLTHELPDLLFSAFKAAIDAKRANVYEYFSWQVHNILNAITKDNLTVSQQKEAVKELLFKANQAADYAITHGVGEGIDMVSHVIIETWFKKDTRLGFEGLYTFGRMIISLNKYKLMSTMYIDDFFMIARTLSHGSLDAILKTKIVKYILDVAIKIVSTTDTPEYVKNSFLYQLQWLNNGYLKTESDLASLLPEYSQILEKLLQGFDMMKIHEQ